MASASLADEADGADAKKRASHVYCYCFLPYGLLISSLFSVINRVKGGNLRQLRQPGSIEAAGGQDGQVVREKGVYIIFILYLLSTTTYYYYSLIYLTHLTQKRKTPVN